MALLRSLHSRVGLIALIPLVGLPLVVREIYILEILIGVFAFAIYAMSWNLLANSGQASLGHAAFFGLGAYSSVLLARNLGASPWLTMIVGPLIPALTGLGIGLLCVRLREWFLAMVTFGFAIIVETLVIDPLRWLTRGWDGLAVPMLISGPFEIRFTSLYYVAFLFMMGAYVATYWLLNSKFGLAISAIRDNEIVANVTGVNLTKFKLLAFVVSAYIAGLAGALESHSVGRYISPEIFAPQNSFWPLVYSISGGIGTPEGPIIGTMLIRLFWETLRFVGGFESMIIIGFILVLEVIFLPHGLAPLIRSVLPARPAVSSGLGILGSHQRIGATGQQQDLSKH